MPSIGFWRGAPFAGSTWASNSCYSWRAFADPETGAAYRRAEGTAEKLREGMWRGEFEKPWEWRRARGVPAPPQGATEKQK